MLLPTLPHTTSLARGRRRSQGMKAKAGRAHLYGRGRRTIPAMFVAVASVLLLLTAILGRKRRAEGEALRRLPTEPRENGSKREACPITSAAPLYVFLHLHKTAGNTLKKALFAFAKRNALNLHHTCHASTGDSLLTAWWFNRDKSAYRALDCNLDTLAALPPSKRAEIDLVMGHQFVGAHTLFPGRDVRYFTFVRHPLSRKVSHFLHFESKAPSASLSRYLVERNKNYMVKRLATDARAGEIMEDLRGRFVDVDSFAARAALRAAKHNLAQRFFFVGLQERYKESVCVLAAILNSACGRNGRLASAFSMPAARIVRHKQNDTHGKTERRVAALPSSVRNAALLAEGADLELYHFAEKLFEDKLQLYPECRAKEKRTADAIH